MQAGPSCMNQTNIPKENTTPSKRPRRHYDAEFKKAAVEHCARHGGDLSGTAAELGINYWTLRDWVEAARATAAPRGPAAHGSRAGGRSPAAARRTGPGDRAA